MLRIREMKIGLEDDESILGDKAAGVLKIQPSDIKKLEIFKRSIYVKKGDIKFVYVLDVEVDADEKTLCERLGDDRITICEKYRYILPESKRKNDLSPIVVGFGPAGMFAGLILARCGARPIILERGRDIDSRTADVNIFWTQRKLDTRSNIQYGEGGAGTFSDGKLTTGIKDTRCRFILEEFVNHGAPEDILVNSKPHIGTDNLKKIVKSIREEIISLGGQVLFETRLTDIIAVNGFIHGVSIEDKNNSRSDIETDAVILSIGHSARDTLETLKARGINMMQKPFSVGARIEHPQEYINEKRYGKYKDHPKLAAADYKLACHPPHGRGAYTFCMCPGGVVVSATSDEGHVVTNGMSEYSRTGTNANAAILVGVEPEDFPTSDVLSGFDLQSEIETKAFALGGGDYSAPAQLVGDFINQTPSNHVGSVKPTFTTGVKMGDISLCLPSRVTNVMRDALQKMDKEIQGFALPDAVLTAPETRSSSPVRVIRDEYFQSNIRGLFPCGEGAGYAGGIVSAAVDGVKCAEALLTDER
ncbi:MAG: hypothetical protein K5761_04105 [Clostridiales bacterium]|nr:hypothetical protein [Clostridiales bacterium]